jgi:chromosome partitioning protein
MRITIGNLKGGAGKSTSSWFIALYLAIVHRRRVLLVDADPLSQTATDWAAVALAAELNVPITVITLVNADTLGRQVESLARDYDDVVIDTGGENELIFSAALMVCEELIVTVAPTPAELRRLPATFAVAARIDAISPVTARVLLVRVRKGTKAADAARGLLEGEGLPVMAAQISLWQHYVDAYGSVPEDLGEYVDVMEELLGETASEEVSA